MKKRLDISKLGNKALLKFMLDVVVEISGGKNAWIDVDPIIRKDFFNLYTELEKRMKLVRDNTIYPYSRISLLEKLYFVVKTIGGGDDIWYLRKDVDRYKFEVAFNEIYERFALDEELMMESHFKEIPCVKDYCNTFTLPFNFYQLLSRFAGGRCNWIKKREDIKNQAKIFINYMLHIDLDDQIKEYTIYDYKFHNKYTNILTASVELTKYFEIVSNTHISDFTPEMLYDFKVFKKAFKILVKSEYPDFLLKTKKMALHITDMPSYKRHNIDIFFDLD